MLVPCLKICLLTWNSFGYQTHSPNMCYMPTSTLMGTMTATSTDLDPRMPFTTFCHWLLPLWWIWIPHLYWLLLFQNASHFSESLHPNAMQQRQYLSWRSYLQSIGFQSPPCTDNGPQFKNALFAEFSTELIFDHNTSMPRSPRRNG